MKKSITLLLGIAFAFMSLSAAHAQEPPKAIKYDNVKWYEAWYYKFKPDKVNEALKIIYDHIVPADKAAGQEIIYLDFRTGEWHHAQYLLLESGASEIEWRTKPSDARWLAAFTQQMGGAEKAQELFKKWRETIAESKKEIVMRRVEEAPKWAQEQLEKWYAAFNAGDASTLMKLYAADAVLFLSEQTLRGRAAIEAFQKENFQKARYACTWVIDGAQALGKQATVWGHDSCTETPKAGGAPRTVNSRWLTVLEQQQDGSWLIVRDSGEEIKEVK